MPLAIPFFLSWRVEPEGTKLLTMVGVPVKDSVLLRISTSNRTLLPSVSKTSASKMVPCPEMVCPSLMNTLLSSAIFRFLMTTGRSAPEEASGLDMVKEAVVRGTARVVVAVTGGVVATGGVTTGGMYGAPPPPPPPPEVQLWETLGLPVVVPQLLESVQVLDWELFEHVDQSPQVQDSEQGMISVWQETETPVTFALETVPEPLETEHVCPDGCVSIVTA